VVVWTVDRFARTRRDDANVLFEIEMSGATLISATENIDNTPRRPAAWGATSLELPSTPWPGHGSFRDVAVVRFGRMQHRVRRRLQARQDGRTAVAWRHGYSRPAQ
jgi:hypothetical protein